MNKKYNVKKQQIRQLFQSLTISLYYGLYFSGNTQNGLFKQYYEDYSLYQIYNLKNGYIEGELLGYDIYNCLHVKIFYKNKYPIGYFFYRYDKNHPYFEGYINPKNKKLIFYHSLNEIIFSIKNKTLIIYKLNLTIPLKSILINIPKKAIKNQTIYFDQYTFDEFIQKYKLQIKYKI